MEETQTQLETKPKSKTILIISLLGIVAILGVGIGVYFWQKSVNDMLLAEQKKETEDLRNQIDSAQKKKNSEKPTTQNQQAAVATEKKEVVPAYATDWYKFVSPNYGFSFRYPKTGVNYEYPNGSLTPTTVSKACSYPLYVSDQFIPGVDNGGMVARWYYGNFFSIGVYPTEGRNISAFTTTKDPEKVHSYSNISISGAKEAVKISTTLNKQVEGYPPFAYWQNIISDGRYFYVIMGNQATNSNDDCYLSESQSKDQIIGTFNFYN